MTESQLSTEVFQEVAQRAVEAVAEAVAGNDVLVEASVDNNGTVYFLIGVVVVFGVALLVVICFCVVAYRVPG